jgi:predicted ester cyclase
VTASDAAKEVVRLNNDQVLGKGNFQLFEDLFANDFHEHTPPSGVSPDKDGVRQLYKVLRTAFPDFHAKVHWQLVDRDFVTTYKTYSGTHRGDFLGMPPTCREVQFEALDVLRVRYGKLAEHWGWRTSSRLYNSYERARRLNQAFFVRLALKLPFQCGRPTLPGRRVNCKL